MKRLSAYFILAVILSLMLCGCGSTTERGNVASSPWPEMTVPTTPVPTAAVSPLPELNMGNDNTVNNGGETGTGSNAPDMSTSTPRMTSSPTLSSSPKPADTGK